MSSHDEWWSPWRPNGSSLVLHVDLRPNPDREERALELLDEDERARWKRFVVRGARRRYALCRAALRINLCQRLRCSNSELTFGYREHGKPFAMVNGRPAAASFNVSHSGLHGLIGSPKDPVRRGPGGAQARPGLRRHREPRLWTARAARVGRLRPGKAELFYRLWSLKEALIKALGTGFS